jgi:SPP1 family predicted phage head-tail adaptor
MTNAGKYNKKIKIYKVKMVEDSDGFQTKQKNVVLEPYASVKTTRGYTLIKNGSDFEQAFTNFTIRFPKTEINRDMLIDYKGKTYTIEYLNDIDEEGVELEIQAKEVTH